MKKQFLNLGKALNRAEQKSINGGGPGCPSPDGDCYTGPFWCNPGLPVCEPDLHTN